MSKGEDNLKKKIIIILSALVVVLIGIGFLIYELSSIVYENPVIASLPQADTSDCYYSDGFQDYTDYCKYYYVKQESILFFIKELEQSEGLIKEFDEELWLGTIEKVRVNSEARVTFIFKDGMEIKWSV